MAHSIAFDNDCALLNNVPVAYSTAAEPELFLRAVSLEHFLAVTDLLRQLVVLQTVLLKYYPRVSRATQLVTRRFQTLLDRNSFVVALDSIAKEIFEQKNRFSVLTMQPELGGYSGSVHGHHWGSLAFNHNYIVGVNYAKHILVKVERMGVPSIACVGHKLLTQPFA